MGFFSKRITGALSSTPSIADGVPGQAQVISSTSPHSSSGGQATYKKCRLHLVVQAEGIPATNVEHSQICPVAKWPRPGMTVPVVVSRSDPQRLTINFDQVPDVNEVARTMAAQQAAILNGQVTGPLAGAPGVQFIGGGPEDLNPEQRAKLQQLLGVDLGAATPVAPAAGPGDQDRIERLERLARLHAAGALSDAEFATEKQRLLGG